MENTTEINTIGICELFDKLGYTTDQLLNLSWEQESKIVMDYCKDNNYHYYANPKEDYFEYEGIQQAIEKGCVGVVLENMS